MYKKIFIGALMLSTLSFSMYHDYTKNYPQEQPSNEEFSEANSIAKLTINRIGAREYEIVRGKDGNISSMRDIIYGDLYEFKILVTEDSVNEKIHIMDVELKKSESDRTELLALYNSITRDLDYIKYNHPDNRVDVSSGIEIDNLERILTLYFARESQIY